MKMRHLILLITALGLISSAYARKPAVEDFVGIDSEIVDMTPHGTQVLFNFHAEVVAYQERPGPVIVLQKQAPQEALILPQGLGFSTWLGVILVLALPVVTWSLTMRHLKSRGTQPTAETVGNVRPLHPAKTQTDDDVDKAA